MIAKTPNIRQQQQQLNIERNIQSSGGTTGLEVVALFEHLCLAADLMVFYQQSMVVQSSYLLFLLAFPFSPSTPSNVQIEDVRLGFGNARAETVQILYNPEDRN